MRTSSIRKRFKSSISRGTGEAYLLMKQYPDVDFSEEIIHAACHNLAYDPQCEHYRDQYIFELINLATKRDKIFKAVWAKMVVEKSDDYGLNQMYHIAVRAAQAGDDKARLAIYKRFEKSIKRGWSYYGGYAVVELDGVEGLLRVADLRGRMLAADPDDWTDSLFVDQFQEENPGIDAWKSLKSAGRKNGNIAHYLKEIKENKREPRKDRVPYTYESLTQRIQSGKWFSAALALKDLEADDLDLLAHDYLAATKPDEKRLYLSLFTKCQFPLGYKPILQLLESGVKGRLRYTAIQALSLFKHPALRRLFENKLETKDAFLYILLLCENYKRGDSQLLTDLINRTKNKDEIHTIAADMEDVFIQNATPDCVLPIEAVYEKLNCGFHREYLLRLLVEYDILPDRIRQEMAYDCNVDIRAMVH